MEDEGGDGSDEVQDSDSDDEEAEGSDCIS